jgi:DnaK suppressor protein
MTELSAQDVVNEERTTTTARVEALTAEFDDIVAGTDIGNSDDEHDPEGSTIAFERTRVAALLSQGRAYLEELERAQGRIDDGTYGTCESCGAAIPPERLVALPTARTCVQCRPTAA